MKRFPAWCGLAAMLLTLVSGPFFHLHVEEMESDHAVIHSHLPESFDDHSEPEFDRAPGHDGGKSVEFFLAKSVSGFQTAFLVKTRDEVPVSPAVRLGYRLTEIARAHDPPALSALGLRSPPL